MKNISKIIVDEKLSIKDVLQIINNTGLGIALVCDKNKKLIGIVTDGDIRRAFLKNIDLRAPISTIMNTNPVTLEEGTSVKDILELVYSKKIAGKIPILKHGKVVDIAILPTEKAIALDSIIITADYSIKDAMRMIDRTGLGIALVCDKNKKLIAIVTDGDIRRAILKGIDVNQSVSTIMNRNFTWITKDTTSEEIVELVRNRKISGKIPVVENGKVIDLKLCCNDLVTSIKTMKERVMVNRILVIGGAGYLGSVLVEELLKENFHVTVLDGFIHENYNALKHLYDDSNIKIIRGDIRDMRKVLEAVKPVRNGEGIDAVIHLAAIVGDPASAVRPEDTIEINYLATKTIAEVCKYNQINRFIFASTCSVYGASPIPDKQLDEDSPLDISTPLSLYGRMKLRSEEAIMEMKDKNFLPTIFRMATLFGLSPRMRFDLVVNLLIAKAIVEKRITIFGGKQWRPNLHVRDAARAYIKCLKTPLRQIGGQIFNLGANELNYQIQTIGEIIQQEIREASLVIDTNKIDERNYNISFSKIKNILNFIPQYDIKYAINEIKKEFQIGKIKNYKDKKYSNV